MQSTHSNEDKGSGNVVGLVTKDVSFLLVQRLSSPSGRQSALVIHALGF